MITKERLEELIEQGATIYTTDWKEEIDLYYPCEIVNVVLTDGTIIERLIVHEDKDHHPSYALIGLTEDIETAKWEEEFGCIERTERLELPTWEEIQKYERFCFKDKNCNSYTLHYISGFKTLSIVGLSNEFYGEATKENYTLACRKAKELFLGLGENK